MEISPLVQSEEPHKSANDDDSKCVHEKCIVQDVKTCVHVLALYDGTDGDCKCDEESYAQDRSS